MMLHSMLQMTDRTSKKRPWDRLPNETPAPWAAFEIYRELGPTRTLTAAAKISGHARGTFSRHCSVYNWRARVRAWDEHVAATYDEEILDVARVKAREQLALWDDLSSIAAAEASRRVELLDTDEVEDVDLRELILLAEKVTSYQRLIVGEATERSEARHTIDVGKLTPETADALAAAMDELGVEEL